MPPLCSTRRLRCSDRFVRERPRTSWPARAKECARKSSSQAADDHAVENIRHPEEGGHENGERQPIKFCCHGGVPFLRMPKSDLLVGKCQRVAFSRLGRELSIFLEQAPAN